MLLAWGSLGALIIPNWSVSIRPGRSFRHNVIVSYWLFLGTLIFPYFLSGLWKILYGGLYSLFADDLSFWNLQAMSYLITNYNLYTQERAWLGDFLIQLPALGWASLWAGIVVELLALAPLFCPRLWRPVVGLLVLLHILSVWILQIHFSYQYLTLIFVLFTNPFANQCEHWMRLFRAKSPGSRGAGQ